jgi:hypothetical protein
MTTEEAIMVMMTMMTMMMLQYKDTHTHDDGVACCDRIEKDLRKNMKE